jgi:Predicted nucleotide-binding protein containing TIR-like domain
MTADTVVTRKQPHGSFAGPNLNVLFEVGAAYGRHGTLRTFIVKSPEVEMITDLSGLITIPLKKGVDDPTFDTHLSEIARKLSDGIQTVLRSPNDGQGGTLRWLSLMRCKPANQDFVMSGLDALISGQKPGIKYICRGVVWGVHDDFVLFSAPSVGEFIEFITKLRVSLNPHIESVDSRMVFPAKYWQMQGKLSPTAKVFHMVLLSCRPGLVEPAYSALLRAAERSLNPIQIVCVGILTGDADIFFITAGEDTSSHQDFIQKHLPASILNPTMLSANTISLPITSFRLEDAPTEGEPGK